MKPSRLSILLTLSAFIALILLLARIVGFVMNWRFLPALLAVAVLYAIVLFGYAGYRRIVWRRARAVAQAPRTSPA